MVDVLSDGKIRDYLTRMEMDEEGIRKSISNIRMYIKMRMMSEKDFVYDSAKALRKIRGVIVKDGMIKIRTSSDDSHLSSDSSHGINTESKRIRHDFGEYPIQREIGEHGLFACLQQRKITPPLTPPQRPSELRMTYGSPKQHETSEDILRRRRDRDTLRNLNIQGEKDHIVREILRN